MNILLWVLQAALALMCVGGGSFQIFKIDELAKTVAAMRELPHGLWAVLGTLGCLEGIALIVPGVIKVAPGLTPIAAGRGGGAIAADQRILSLLWRPRPPALCRGDGADGGVRCLWQVRAQAILRTAPDVLG